MRSWPVRCSMRPARSPPGWRGAARCTTRSCAGRAAEAAYEVTASGVYSLVPWEDYDHIFTDTRPGTNVVYSSETIFQKIHNAAVVRTR